MNPAMVFNYVIPVLPLHCYCRYVWRSVVHSHCSACWHPVPFILGYSNHAPIIRLLTSSSTFLCDWSLPLVSTTQALDNALLQFLSKEYLLYKEQNHSKIPDFECPFEVSGIFLPRSPILPSPPAPSCLVLCSTINIFYADGFHLSLNCEKVVDNQAGCSENACSTTVSF